MQLWPVESFFLHKKVPVYSCIVLQVPFCDVQLVRVAFFRSDFLQNPYFNLLVMILTEFNSAELSKVYVN